MNRRIWMLSFALLALAGALGWMIRQYWLDARKRETAVLRRRVPEKKLLEPPAVPAPKPVAPGDYLDIAQRMLFSKDRNPTVVIEPPPAKPEPPMPALPHYHGQMAIGDPIALLSVSNNVQKPYHVGDDVGDFKLVAFDRDTITLAWRDKTVQRKLAELTPKEAPPPTPPPAAPPAPNAAAPQAPNASTAAAGPGVTSLGGTATAGSTADQSSGAKVGPTLGPEIAGGVRACVPGDDSPAGTTLSGYKKNIIQSMFGAVCRWEPTK